LEVCVVGLWDTNLLTRFHGLGVALLS